MGPQTGDRTASRPPAPGGFAVGVGRSGMAASGRRPVDLDDMARIAYRGSQRRRYYVVTPEELARWPRRIPNWSLRACIPAIVSFEGWDIVRREWSEAPRGLRRESGAGGQD
jgi:hypothetical protein